MYDPWAETLMSEMKREDTMKSKLILCLALVLSGGLYFISHCGRDKSNQSTNLIITNILILKAASMDQKMGQAYFTGTMTLKTLTLQNAF